MGEIIGLGCIHCPGLMVPVESLPAGFHRLLTAPRSQPADWALELHGHREAAKYLATSLIRRGIDLAYAYKPQHHRLAHAVTNTFLYLDGIGVGSLFRSSRSRSIATAA
jgi:hypothetical protein